MSEKGRAADEREEGFVGRESGEIVDEGEEDEREFEFG